MSRKKVLLTMYFEPRQIAALKALSASTRVPYAKYVREAIDLVIEQETATVVDDDGNETEH